MPDYAALENDLVTSLQLARRPVAIAFRDAPVAGVPKFTGTQPAGCSFWRLSAEGQTFYTVAQHHHNCPIGSYTHNIPLPSSRERDLSDVLSLMNEIGYLRLEEVPSVPRLARTPGVTIYAPLAQAPVDPDAVILSGTPGGLMLLHEAAASAKKPAASLLGRPTCMAIPAALNGAIASSLGCVGNRVYTGLQQDEFYTVVAGADLPGLVAEMRTIVAANVLLSEYHEARRTTLATS